MPSTNPTYYSIQEKKSFFYGEEVLRSSVFFLKGDKEMLLAIKERIRVPCSSSDCTQIAPHQYVVEETAGEQSLVHREFRGSGMETRCWFISARNKSCT